MYNLTQCTADFNLSLKILTHWCIYVYKTNYNGTNAENFIIANCCPRALNITGPLITQTPNIEEIGNICEYLSSKEDHIDNYSHEKCFHKRQWIKSTSNYYSRTLELCFYSVIVPIGLIGNLLVVVTISQTIRSHNYLSMMFVRNLAVADLISLFAFIVCLVVYNHVSLTVRVREYLFPTLDIFSGTLSMNSITMISIDRAVAVVYPMRHFSGANNSKGKFCILVMWAFSFTLLFLSLSRMWIVEKLFNLYFLYSVVAAFLLPCFLVLISYTIIIAFTIRSNRQMVRANARRNSITLRGISRFREIKLAINVTVIILPFMFGWGFVSVVTVLSELLHKLKLAGAYSFLVNIIPITVSSINPLVYLMLTSSLRKNSIKTFQGMFRRICKRKNHLKFFEGRLLTRSVSRGSSKVTEVSGLNEELQNDLNENNI